MRSTTYGIAVMATIALTVAPAFGSGTSVSAATELDDPGARFYNRTLWAVFSGLICARGEKDKLPSKPQCDGYRLKGHNTLMFGPETITSDFVNGLPEGHIVIEAINGRHFEGEIHEGVLNGPGTVTTSAGVINVNFANSQLDGPAHFLDNKSGTVMDYAYRAGMRDGPLTIKSQSSVYQVAFQQDAIDSRDVAIFKDRGQLNTNLQGDDIEATFRTTQGKLIKGAFSPAKPDPSVPHTVEYPEMSNRLGERCTVGIWTEIAEDGSLSSATIARFNCPDRLEVAALAAVKTWKFIPATIEGHPVPSYQLIAVPFEPDQPPADQHKQVPT